MAKITCPKCKYKDAEKIDAYTKEGRGMNKTFFKTITWTCPKCNFEKSKKVEMTRDQYEVESGIAKEETERWKASEKGSGAGSACCSTGLIPTIFLFLPFMTIYPNQKILLSIIDFHQKKSSTILNKHNFKCGFTPSCSEYSKIAINKYGAFKGGFMSIWRIAKCNPFNKNKGIDYP